MGMDWGAKEKAEKDSGLGERRERIGMNGEDRKEGGRLLWKPGNMLYPLPVVMVSCARPGEKPNIITVAWAGTICSDPVMLSISVRPERYSYSIIRETGEFVVNLVNRELVRATDFCGVKSGRDVDKFRELGLTPSPSAHVGAPGIGESPLSLECRVTQVIPLGSHDLFLAEVVGVDVDSRYLDEKGKFRLNDSGLVTYSHGEYFGLGEKLGSFGYSVRKKVDAEPPKEQKKQSVGPPEKQKKLAKGREKRAGKNRQRRIDT